MSERPDIERIISHQMTSLLGAKHVNGVPYNNHTFQLPDTGSVDERRAQMMLAYYTPGTLSETMLCPGIQMEPGEPPTQELLAELWSGACYERLVKAFAGNPATASVVDFTRETYAMGMSPAERRHETACYLGIPMAVVAFAGAAQGQDSRLVSILTPQFVWPHAAFREMGQALTGES